MKNSRTIPLLLCAVAAGFALGGCGGGGSNSGAESSGAIISTPPAGVVNDTLPAKAANFYTLTEDAYGMQNATFMSAGHSTDSMILRVAIAEQLSDPDFVTVFRIDISRPADIVDHVSYAVGGDTHGSAVFPGEILFFNGHKSTMLKTSSGTITFTSYGTKAGDLVAGNFAVSVEDGNSNSIPKPLYAVNGNFGFIVESSGALQPSSSPVPVTAAASFDTKCAGCHTLGSIGLGGAAGPDLSLKGGRIDYEFRPDVFGHHDRMLSAGEMHDLKILLNAS